MAGRLPLVDIGQRLRDLRCQRGLTIRDLAQSSGLNVNTLSMIENGKNSPSLETLHQLSFALDIPVTAFFESVVSKEKIAYFKAGQRSSVSFAYGVLEDLGAGMSRLGATGIPVWVSPTIQQEIADLRAQVDSSMKKRLDILKARGLLLSGRLKEQNGTDIDKGKQVCLIRLGLS